jgi:uncharacterized membrane protein YgcG
VAEAVLDMATDDSTTTQTARQLWVAIEGLFQANKVQRAIFLSHEFHSMTQGNSSIDDYCLRVKVAADKIRDVGHPVGESQLVLNLPRGQNEEFSGTAGHIAGTNLTLTYARDQLSLKELRLANAKKVATGTALVTNPTSSCSPSDCCGQPHQQPPYQPPQLQRGDGQRRHDKKGGRRNFGNDGGGFSGGQGGFGGGQGGSGKGQGAPSSGQTRPFPPAGQWVCFTPGGQHWVAPGGSQQWRGGHGLLGSGPS